MKMLKMCQFILYWTYDSIFTRVDVVAGLGRGIVVRIIVGENGGGIKKRANFCMGSKSELFSLDDYKFSEVNK
jgi:hypothetical protein